MTQRSFDDAFWGDPFVQELEKDAKLLFLYLWTNKRCNSAGLYEITMKTIAFETGIAIEDLPSLFDLLKPKIKRFADTNIIWVKNFLKRQPKSPLFLKSVADCLVNLNNNGLIEEFLNYNSSLGVSIPFNNGLITVSKGFGIQTEPEQDIEIDKDIDIINDILSKGNKLKKYPTHLIKPCRAVIAAVKEKRGYNSRKPAAEAEAVYKMLEEGFTPEDILRAYDIIVTRPYFQDKPLLLMTVYQDIHEVLKHGTHKQAAGRTPARYTKPEELLQ